MSWRGDGRGASSSAKLGDFKEVGTSQDADGGALVSSIAGVPLFFKMWALSCSFAWFKAFFFLFFFKLKGQKSTFLKGKTQAVE